MSEQVSGKHGPREDDAIKRDLVSRLPDETTYGNLHELLTALGIPVEERPS